jgi:hypothetical protein
MFDFFQCNPTIQQKPHATPTELSAILGNVVYKHSTPSGVVATAILKSHNRA